MDHNLALLPADQKQKIELDKQASYAVWKIKNGFADKRMLAQQTQAIVDDNERDHFADSIEKYLKKMGI